MSDPGHKVWNESNVTQRDNALAKNAAFHGLSLCSLGMTELFATSLSLSNTFLDMS